MILYHYTCDHGLESIAADDWTVRPNPATRELLPAYGLPHLAWFTDMGAPDRLALGLTSWATPCDRGAHRLRVTDPSGLLPWWRWCRLNAYPRSLRDTLELVDGVQPMRWWVSGGPVRVVECR